MKLYTIARKYTGILVHREKHKNEGSKIINVLIHLSKDRASCEFRQCVWRSMNGIPIVAASNGLKSYGAEQSGFLFTNSFF
ncbi:MAG: hypothetical protein HQK83_10845 [Fibrobacteria bacterium]|nr:hypothetical protein [Fibrobacteria bacterium]